MLCSSWRNWFVIKNKLSKICSNSTFPQKREGFNFVGERDVLIGFVWKDTISYFTFFLLSFTLPVSIFWINTILLITSTWPAYHSPAQPGIGVCDPACAPQAPATLYRAMVFIWSGNKIFVLLKIELAIALSITVLCYKVT